MNSKFKRHLLSGYSTPTSGVNPLKVDLLRQSLLPGSVLDVGCGNGLYGLVVVSLGSSVLQLDIEDRRAPEARHLPFRAMDVQRLDLPDNSFDNVIAFDIMEHIDNDAFFLQEVRRVLKKRGRLILSVPNSDDEQLRLLSLTHIHHTDKTHRREYTEEGLTTILDQEGFTIIKFLPQFNKAMPFFAHALVKKGFFPKIAARFISLQCLLFEGLGLFENRCVADWFCVADSL